LFYHSLFAYLYGHGPLAWHCRDFISIVGSAFSAAHQTTIPSYSSFSIITFNISHIVLTSDTQCQVTVHIDGRAPGRAVQLIASGIYGNGSPCLPAFHQQNDSAEELNRSAALMASAFGQPRSGMIPCEYRVKGRNERGSEQLPYEFSSTSLAHLRRGIAERKWVEACSWMESRLSKHHAYRPRKMMRPDPTPAKASKAVASFPPVQDGVRPHRAVPQEDRQARLRHLLVVRPRS